MTTRTFVPPRPFRITAQTSAPTLRRKCDCTGKGADCKCDEEKPIQRYAASTQQSQGQQPNVSEALGSDSQPLDDSVRSAFESRFGVDFSAVRIHAGPRAADSARSLNALAFTFGRDIIFNRGQYAPRSRDGARVLAHELAHVAQQKSANFAVSGGEPVTQPSDASEVEADRIAEEVMKEGAPK